jgi:hypothetical protein
MADNLDFKDISNSLYLSNSENHALACHYAQISILQEAKTLPSLEWHPAIADTIMTCKVGDYDPLDLMDSFEASASSLRYQWSASIPKDVDFEDLLSTSEQLAELHDKIGDSGDELIDKFALIGRISRLSRCTLEYGVNLRRFYTELLTGAKMLSAERETDTYSVLEEQCHTDELVRLVFPKKETAISELGDITFFFLPLWKQLKLISTAREFPDQGEWKEFYEMASALPAESDIDDALRLHCGYVANEMDRIYS